MIIHIPNGAIVPFYIASFLMLSFQYYRIDPDRRVFNLHFGLMAGAILLIFFTVSLIEPLLSMILFGLALLWVAVSIYLFRTMPPSRH